VAAFGAGVELAGDDAEFAGEATCEACARRKGPKHRRSNSQALETLSVTRTSTRLVVATGCCSDGGEEPGRDGECSGEARARRGGPNCRRSTTQEKDPNTHKHRHDSVHSSGVDGKDWNRLARPLVGCKYVEEHPTTANLNPKTEKPKTKRTKRRRETPRPKLGRKMEEDGGEECLSSLHTRRKQRSYQEFRQRGRHVKPLESN
jgi:hypothetical protein